MICTIKTELIIAHMPRTAVDAVDLLLILPVLGTEPLTPYLSQTPTVLNKVTFNVVSPWSRLFKAVHVRTLYCTLKRKFTL